jgi:hypothetical protein
MLIGGLIATPFARSEYWDKNIIVIALSTGLFGVLNVLRIIISLPSNQNLNQPKTFQFSITRLLIATMNVGIVFGVARSGNAYKFDNLGEILIISIIAISLGALTLICKKSDIKSIMLLICPLTIIILVLILTAILI